MQLLKNTWKHRALLLMALPAIILFLMFSYAPMFGLLGTLIPLGPGPGV